MPSVTSHFNVSDLAYLQDKRARIFIDDDAPGQTAAECWATELKSAGITVDGFSFAGFLMSGGLPVNDLNDLLKIDYDCWERSHEKVENIINFAL
jgi:hypothetical protein